MESIDKVKIARKKKGYSHENMVSELGMSQAAYTNIQKNIQTLR